MLKFTSEGQDGRVDRLLKMHEASEVAAAQGSRIRAWGPTADTNLTLFI